jgi:hypothetical protein
MPSQLGVEHLVRAVLEPLQEIRPPAPAVVIKGPLENHGGPVADHPLGRANGPAPTVVGADLNNAIEPGEYRELVLLALASERGTRVTGRRLA